MTKKEAMQKREQLEKELQGELEADIQQQHHLEEVLQKELLHRKKMSEMVDIIVDGDELSDEVMQLADFSNLYVFVPKKIHMHKMLFMLSGLEYFEPPGGYVCR